MTFYTRQCDCCGKQYTGQSRKYCSRACYFKTMRESRPLSRLCEHCGNEFAFKYYDANQGYDRSQRFCGTECAKEAQRTWYIDKHGYRVTGRRGKQCFEHREVMENHLGRKLLPSETVHHKNAKRLDNRIENLELWTGRHGKGARLQDRIKDSINLLVENKILSGFTSTEFAAGIVLGG